MGEFAEMVDDWSDPDLVRFSRRRGGAQGMARMVASRKPREGVKLDLGPCVKAMRDKLPANTIICNGAGNFSGWWHRYWRYGADADPARADQRDDGLRPARRGRRRAPLQGPAGGRASPATAIS